MNPKPLLFLILKQSEYNNNCIYKDDHTYNLHKLGAILIENGPFCQLKYNIYLLTRFLVRCIICIRLHFVMSELAWKLSPKFNRRHKRPMLSIVPNEFKEFIKSKIEPISSENKQEIDFMIRRALALWRLQWYNVPDAWHLLDKRFQETLGEDWQEEFEKKNGKIEMVEL